MGVLQEVERECVSVIVSGPSCYTIIGASVSMDFCHNDSCQKIWENCLFAISLFLWDMEANCLTLLILVVYP